MNASLGIFYLKLQYLVADQGKQVTAKRPMKITLTRKKGMRVRGFQVGKALAWVEVPEEDDSAQQLAKSAVEMMQKQLGHVVYEQACYAERG